MAEQIEHFVVSHVHFVLCAGNALYVTTSANCRPTTLPWRRKGPTEGNNFSGKFLAFLFTVKNDGNYKIIITKAVHGWVIRIYHEVLHVYIRLTFSFFSHLLLLLLFIKSIKETMSSEPLWIFPNHYHVRLATEILACRLRAASTLMPWIIPFCLD